MKINPAFSSYNTRILIVGLRVGSVVAECALRMGFHTISIIDGATVEESDLSTGIYTGHNLHAYKAWAVTERLLEIAPEATICFSNVILTQGNIHQYIRSCEVVINTLRYGSAICEALDAHCAEMGIISVHPYCRGGKATAFCTGGRLRIGIDAGEQDCGGLLMSHQLHQIEGAQPAAPNVASSYKAAALVCDILYDIVSGKPVRMLPGSYTSGDIEAPAAAEMPELLRL